MTRLSGMRTWIVLGAVVVGLSACSSGGKSGSAGSTTTTLPGDDVHINQIQVLGSHNS